MTSARQAANTARRVWSLRRYGTHRWRCEDSLGARWHYGASLWNAARKAAHDRGPRRD